MRDGRPPESERSDNRLREIALICLLVTAGVVATVGALWVGWEIGGALP
jgi:hypothetical protein